MIRRPWRILPLETRFWPKVKRGGPDDCWLWTGATRGGKDGKWYGCLVVRFTGKPVSTAAHRVSWVLQVGMIPVGFCVLHRCDNGLCVNPGHLFLGTNEDNIQDMVNKGRQVHGERQHSARLTRRDVLAIRAAWRAGETQTSLAERYPVTQPTISSICRKKIWRWL